MGLFSEDKSFKEYEDFKDSRKKFSEANHEMRDSIHTKTSDSKNIDYPEVHVNIYETIGLGKDWRIDNSIQSSEIKKATYGFQKVTEGLEPFPDKSIPSKSLLKVILSFF